MSNISKLLVLAAIVGVEDTAIIIEIKNNNINLDDMITCHAASKLIGFSPDYIRQTFVRKHNLLRHTRNKSSKNTDILCYKFTVAVLIELSIFLNAYRVYRQDLLPYLENKNKLPKAYHFGLEGFVDKYGEYFNKEIKTFLLKTVNERMKKYIK